MIAFLLGNHSRITLHGGKNSATQVMCLRFFIPLWILHGIFLTLFSSCSLRLPTPAPLPASSTNDSVAILPNDQPTVAIYLIADSLHTSLAVPYQWLLTSGYDPPRGLKFSRCTEPYVVMSWGDRVAYEQRRWLGPGEVFNALFLPSDSVTEIIPISWKVEEVCYQQRIYRKEIPHQHGTALAAFLNANQRMDENGVPRVIGTSSWGEGFLLDCHHSYYFPRICNIWTAQSLEACGMNISMKSAISANGLIRQAREHGFELIHEGNEESRFGRDAAKPRKQ